MNSDELFLSIYKVVSVLIGIVAFFASWAYAVASYGWFLGLGLGWIPALVIGVIAALVWPLPAVLALYLLSKTPEGRPVLDWIGGAILLVLGVAVLYSFVTSVLPDVLKASRRAIRFAIDDPRKAWLWLLVICGVGLDFIVYMVGICSPFVAYAVTINTPQLSRWATICIWLLAASAMTLAGITAWRRRQRRRAWYDPPGHVRV